MNPVKLISLSHSSNVICGTGNMRKSPKMQSFGIKIERIDRDLLCIYETNAKWASVHICSVKWAELGQVGRSKGDLDLRFKVVLWSTLT